MTTEQMKRMICIATIPLAFTTGIFAGRYLEKHAKDQTILADKLGLSDSQLKHVRNSERGCGLILFDNVVIPFRDHYPTDTKTYAIMNTTPQEAAKTDT